MQQNATVTLNEVKSPAGDVTPSNISAEAI